MSLSLAGATLIGAGLSATGGVLSNIFNRRGQRRQHQHEMNLWNMTNDYNSPVAQMQRLREAGLNPHLVHGNANQADQPNVSPEEPGSNPFDIILPAVAQISQIRATNAEIAKKEAEIEHIQGSTRNQDIVRRDYELRESMSQFDQYLRQRQHELERSKHGHNVDMSRYTREAQLAQAERDRARAELFLEQAASSRELTPAQVAKLRQDMRFQSELHLYNLQSSRARATIDQFNSTDRMLNLLEHQLMNNVHRIIAETDRAKQRRVLGIDVGKDNFIRRILFSGGKYNR